jgi:voltage-gated potassium channel
MSINLKGHIIICNWNLIGDKMIRELHAPVISPKRDIIVISQCEIDEDDLRLSPEYEKVFFMRNDPTSEEVLKHASAKDASSIILLKDYESPDPDAKNALTSLAITSLIADNKLKPWIVAELTEPSRSQHLSIAGVDEVVCAHEFSLGIIAQCALTPGLSKIFTNLLTISEETNEIYMTEDYPSSLLGKTFKELSSAINNIRDQETSFVLIGVKSNNKILINPQLQNFNTLTKGDSLILISFDQPDFSTIELS